MPSAPVTGNESVTIDVKVIATKLNFRIKNLHGRLEHMYRYFVYT